MRLTSINLPLVEVEVSQLVRHAVCQLVFLHLEAALVHSLLAERAQLDLWSSPIRQNVIRLIQQVIDAIEVPLDSYLHLIALHNLLPRTLELIIGLLKYLPVMLLKTSLLADRPNSLLAIHLNNLSSGGIKSSRSIDNNRRSVRRMA